MKKDKIIDFNKYKKKWEMNIGILIFLVFFIYIIGISVRYFQTHTISTYEVNYGSIINDTEYTGLVIRSEDVYDAESSGYIQFYNLQGSKVSYANYIYTISSTNDDIIQQSTSATTYSLTSSDQTSILSAIQSFNNTYNSLNYSDTYSLSEYITSVLQNSENEERISALDSISSSDSSIDIYKTDTTGIVSYTIDGYENLTVDSFTADDFNQTNYSISKTSTGDSVSLNDSIYKLITDEEWYIIIQIDTENVDDFEDITKVNLRFIDDDTTTSANFELLNKNGAYYGIISMSTGMIRYVTDRHLDIELIFEELEGYKIPITSVVSREFYAIPYDFITKGGEYSSNGVILLNSDGSVEFVETNVYYQDDDYAYVLADEYIANKTILVESGSETMVLNEELELYGVYNVNKGYAEFKYVNILTQSSEYYIVEDSVSFSINNYDRIALYGDSVEEFAIIN